AEDGIRDSSVTGVQTCALPISHGLQPVGLALIPAAGKSTRMGRPKLALPLGGRTVLEHVVAALRDAGVEHVLVVVGPHVPELVRSEERRVGKGSRQRWS